MFNGFYDDGDSCPECKEGKLYYPPVVNCSCHICAPCSACVNNSLKCGICGYVPDEPIYIDIPVAPYADGVGLYAREYKPIPLNPAIIDYRIKGHTAASMICEGVYPAGTTRAEVENKVRGTFGGRFESFGNGRFKYIAYTD